MKRFYQTVLLGATMTALGYAHTHPDCLILESSEFLAPEYTLSLRPVCTKMDPNESELAKFLAARSVMDTCGVFHTLPLLPALCEYVLQEGIEVRLLTEIVSVQKTDEDYTLTVYNAEGLQELHAGQVLDMRHPTGEQKFFHVVCHQAPPELGQQLTAVLPENITLHVWHTGLESYISFAVPREYTLVQARKLVYDCWNRAFPDHQVRISVEAFEFDDAEELQAASPVYEFHNGEQM